MDLRLNTVGLVRRTHIEPRREKTCLLGFRPVGHIYSCTTAKDGYRLDISYKEVEKLYYLCSENNGADQLRGQRAADLRLCFGISKKQVFT